MIVFRLCIITAIIGLSGNANGMSLSDAFKNSYALVIGIDEYQNSRWEKLKYAVRDARAIEKFLLLQNFRVKTLYNEHATQENIMAYLEDELAHTAGKDDRFIFFFAGHGHTEFFAGGEERGYLVPFDGKERSSTYISMARIREVSEIMKDIKHQLFIMDCCYGGMLGSRGKHNHLDPKMPSYLDEVLKRKARQILTAGGATQKVQDIGPEGHSVFTGELLKALNSGLGDIDGDGYITFYELSTYILRAASRRNQTPGVDFLNGHGQGEFIFWNPTRSGTHESLAVSGSSWASSTPRGKPIHEIVKEGKQKFIKEDYAGAQDLFREASEFGNLEATFFSGVILFKIRNDKVEGLRLIREAASRGYLLAMKTLAEYYNSYTGFNETELSYWKKEIADAEMLSANTRLVDPTGEASKGDPIVPPSAVNLQAPSSLRIIVH